MRKHASGFCGGGSIEIGKGGAKNLLWVWLPSLTKFLQTPLCSLILPSYINSWYLCSKDFQMRQSSATRTCKEACDVMQTACSLVTRQQQTTVYGRPQCLLAEIVMSTCYIEQLPIAHAPQYLVTERFELHMPIFVEHDVRCPTVILHSVDVLRF